MVCVSDTTAFCQQESLGDFYRQESPSKDAIVTFVADTELYLT